MLRIVLCLCLAVALGACGGPSGEGRKAPVIRPVAGLPAAFGDTDPHPWGARAPNTYAVHGTDVARYQGSADWQKAAASGIRFAWIKATEGGDRLDEKFREHYSEAGRAGIPRGAYHFYYFCRPAIEQAEWFIRNVPRTRGALPPVLDMEWNHTSPTCQLRPDPAVVRSEAKIFLEALTAHYGTRPVIYSTVDFFHRNEMDRLQGYDFWLRSVAAHPTEIYPGEKFTFWQYTGSGLAPGFFTPVDLNVFNGSPEAWEQWRAARSQ